MVAHTVGPGSAAVPHVHTMGAGPSGRSAWPGGRTSGRHSRNRGHPVACRPHRVGLQDSGQHHGAGERRGPGSHAISHNGSLVNYN